MCSGRGLNHCVLMRMYNPTMAVPARPNTKKSRPARDGRKYGPATRSLPETTVVGAPSNDKDQLTSVQIRAARMFARNVPLRQIAIKLADWVVPNEPDRQLQLKKTRTRIRNWVRSQKFRDAIYEEAMLRVDLRTGAIVDGIVAKAEAGRVDAARLALEITGRHSPHTEIQPAQVNVVFSGVPRPQEPKQIADGEVLDVDAEVEPDED